MRYREIRPSPPLARYVRCVWLLEDPGRGPHPTERILPDGCIELIVHYGDRFERRTNGSAVLQPRAFVLGEMKSHLVVAPTGAVGVLGVRFEPHGAHPFLPMPLGELGEQTIELVDVFGPIGGELEGRLSDAEDDADRLGIVERFLLRQLASGGTDPVVDAAVHRINANVGAFRVSALAESLGMSARQLERRFAARVGMSPKALGRVVRLQRAVEIGEQDRHVRWTDVAQICGYFDQAHFTRDFTAFTGLSPTRFIAETHSMSNFFTGG